MIESSRGLPRPNGVASSAPVQRILGPLCFALASVVGSTITGCQCGEPASTETTEPTTTDDGPRVHGLTEAQSQAVLARIGTHEITVGEFAETIAEKGPFLRMRYNSPERRRELLDQMVRFELLAQGAASRGFDDLPEVQRARNQILIRRFLAREFDDRIQLSDVSDADVAAYYEAHRDQFHMPEQVRASHILLATAAEAQRVMRLVQANPEDVRLFRSLAEQFNRDPNSQDRYGDLGFFSRVDQRRADEPDLPAELVDAAFALDTIGTVSPTVVSSPRGFHIVKLTGRRSPLDRTLEEARETIRNRLWRERREAAVEALVERLRAESDVEEHLELLSEVHIDAPPAGADDHEGALPTEAPTPTPSPTAAGGTTGGSSAPAPSASPTPAAATGGAH